MQLLVSAVLPCPAWRPSGTWFNSPGACEKHNWVHWLCCSSLNIWYSFNEKINKKYWWTNISAFNCKYIYTMSLRLSCKPDEPRNLGCTHGSAVDSAWDLVYDAFSYIGNFYLTTRKTIIYFSERMHQDSCISLSLKFSRYGKNCFYEHAFVWVANTEKLWLFHSKQL